MRIHHLNCISMCPIGGGLTDGQTHGRWRGRLVCHCLAIEAPTGLILVDTGFGTADVAHPEERLSSFFRWQLAPDLRPEHTAVQQLAGLGFAPRDVRHIVLTHLDFDHAGGLDDFPEAQVHMMASELYQAQAQRTWLDRQRFRPHQWHASRARWHTYSAGRGAPWFGFDAVHDLDGLPADILLIPLPGHTAGHAGVAIRRSRGWLLHAGDAYFYHHEMDISDPQCPPGLRIYQRLMEKDRTARCLNQQRLRELKHAYGHDVQIFCAHDSTEFTALCAAAPLADQPLRMAIGQR